MRSVEVIEDRVRHSLFSRLGLSAAAIVGFSLPPAEPAATPPQAAAHEVSIRLELIAGHRSGLSIPVLIERRMARRSASDSLVAVVADVDRRTRTDWSSHALC